MANYPQGIVYKQDDTDIIQYAGYPITRFINNNLSIKGGNINDNTGLARLEGLTIPSGLYIYRHREEIYDTPKGQLQIEVSVIEEPDYQRLIDNISHGKKTKSKKLTKSTKRKNKNSKAMKTKKRLR